MIPAIAFLKGEGPDAKGRMLADYLAFSTERWEECHDHMQWAFPTNTRSAFNPNAPVIPDDFEFDGDPEVRAALRSLVMHYFNSLGIRTVEDPIFGYSFKFPDSWGEEVVPYWASSFDHNMLRITRVIESLGIFGMKDLQEAVFHLFAIRFASMFYETITAKTVAFWVAAKENKLHLLR